MMVLDEVIVGSTLDGKGMVAEWISAKVYYDLLQSILNNRESDFECLVKLPLETASTYIKVANLFIYKSNLDFKEVIDLAVRIFLKYGYYSFFESLRLIMWAKWCQVCKNENMPNILLKYILLRNVREIEDNKEEYEFFIKHVEYISENGFITSIDNKKLNDDIQKNHFEIYNSENHGMN